MRESASKLSLAAGVVIAVASLAPGSALGAASGSFTATGSMDSPRYGAAAAQFADGKTLIAGGWTSTFTNSAIPFDPATNTFGPAYLMNTARLGPAAAPLSAGRVLVAGGYKGGLMGDLASAEILDPATGNFGPVANPMNSLRSLAAAAPLRDGRVLIAGGGYYDGSSHYLASAEVFNPATATFTPVGSMGTARIEAAAAPLADGTVLVVGGTPDNTTILSSAEIFNPATNTFSPVAGPMSTPRRGPVAAALPDGRVLVAGGADGVNYLSSAEIFDPASRTFSSAGIGSMSIPRDEAAAAPLPDGRVLVAGGANASSLNGVASAETFALAKPSNALSFRVQGRNLVLDAQVPGTVIVAGAVGRASAAAQAAKKRIKQLALKPSSATGGPGQITDPLRLGTTAKRKLRTKGKVRLRTTVTFTPKGGECIELFKQCYSAQFAGSQTATLRLKAKRKPGK